VTLAAAVSVREAGASEDVPARELLELVQSRDEERVHAAQALFFVHAKPFPGLRNGASESLDFGLLQTGFFYWSRRRFS